MPLNEFSGDVLNEITPPLRSVAGFVFSRRGCTGLSAISRPPESLQRQWGQEYCSALVGWSEAAENLSPPPHPPAHPVDQFPPPHCANVQNEPSPAWPTKDSFLECGGLQFNDINQGCGAGAAGADAFWS